VIEAAPIVKFMKRWTRARVRDYCRARGWQVSVWRLLSGSAMTPRTLVVAKC
jgi:hypothetical protein